MEVPSWSINQKTNVRVKSSTVLTAGAEFNSTSTHCHTFRTVCRYHNCQISGTMHHPITKPQEQMKCVVNIGVTAVRL